MAKQKRTSAAARRREREALLAEREKNAQLPETFRSWLVHDYAPHSPLKESWPVVRPLVEETLRRSHIRGEESLRKRTTDVGYFWLWMLKQSSSPHVELMSRATVDEYCRVGMPGLRGKSPIDRRSILRRIADHLHPELAPAKGPQGERPSIRPPYSAAELSAIVRVAGVQPTANLRRCMCLCVGLGAGAGLDSADLKILRAERVEDAGDQGLTIHVPGPRARSVPVLLEFEPLVRIGVDGLKRSDLLLGRNPQRHNVAGAVFAQAALHGELPHLEQSRLRSTWLTTLLSRPVPLATIMRAAGLTSARTLTDLIAYAQSTEEGLR